MIASMHSDSSTSVQLTTIDGVNDKTYSIPELDYVLEKIEFYSNS